MPRLIDRQKQIPNGYRFYLPSTKWSPAPYSSFNVIVDGLMANLAGNPHVLQQLGWALDRKFIEEKVDQYNSLLCAQNGWHDYITADGGQPESAPFPDPQTNLSVRLQKVAAGAEILVDWISSGAEAVARELSEHRASVCVTCPKNSQGGFEAFFTVPISNAIRKALIDKDGMHLSTSHDSKLGVCSACLCPMRLKVHVPILKIVKGMPDDSKQQLWENCWIKKEGGF